jgi:hypothetical protein
MTRSSYLLFAHQQITAHVESLGTLLNRFPNTSILVVPPIFCSTPAWFGLYLPDFISFLTAEIGRIGSAQMVTCSPFVVPPSFLDADGVHLTPVAGDRFMAHIEPALTALNDNVHDDGNEVQPTSSASPQPQDCLQQILEAINRNSGKLETIGALGDTVSHLTQATANFEVFVRRRFRQDDYIFARMKEETDTDVNKSREDRVVITGLAGPPLISSTHAEKKQHYKESVTKLIGIACKTEPIPSVVDVYVNIRKEQGKPMVEVRLDTVAGASLFRCEGVRLAKAKVAEFSSLYFANSVTQSTRVRIELLKALSKKLTTPTEVSFVQGFISRPLLQYRTHEGEQSRADGVGRGYTFVDAMIKFGTKLSPRDLTAAYVRAGDTFRGALSQYFIVLSNEDMTRGSRSSANRVPLGRRSMLVHGGSRGGPHGGSRGARTLPTDRGVKRPVDDPSGTPSKRVETVVSDTDTEDGELF